MKNTAGTCLFREAEDESLQALVVEPGSEKPLRLLWRGPVPTDPQQQRQISPVFKDRENIIQLVPDDQVELYQVNLPWLPSKQLKQVVNSTLVRDQGGIVGDWAFSYRILEERKKTAKNEGQLHLSIAYTQQKNVDAELAPALAAQLRPGCMLPGYLVLDQFFRQQHPYGQDGKSWSLVFLGRRSRFVCISNPASMLMTRALPADLSDNDLNDEYLGQLATEIERSLFFAQQAERGLKVDRVVLCGVPEQVAQLSRQIQEESNVTAEAWAIEDLFENTEGDLDPDLLIPLAAAATTGQMPQFNLLPVPRRQIFSAPNRRRCLIGATAAAVAVIPLLLVGGSLTKQVQESYLEKAQHRLPIAAERTDRATSSYHQHQILLAQEANIQKFAVQQPNLAELLVEIAAVTPSEVTYKDLRIQRDAEGAYTLSLIGESVAKTGAQAQKSFMAFWAALNTYQSLVSHGEPSQLQITEQDKSDGGGIKVLFRVTYDIEVGGQG